MNIKIKFLHFADAKKAFSCLEDLKYRPNFRQGLMGDEYGHTHSFEVSVNVSKSKLYQK